MNREIAARIAIGLAVVLAAASLLNGPSEHELAESTAAAMVDAMVQAEREARRCHSAPQRVMLASWAEVPEGDDE